MAHLLSIRVVHEWQKVWPQLTNKTQILLVIQTLHSRARVSSVTSSSGICSVEKNECVWSSTSSSNSKRRGIIILRTTDGGDGTTTDGGGTTGGRRTGVLLSSS